MCLDLTEQNGLLTRYLRVHGLRILILWSTEGKELDAKTMVSVQCCGAGADLIGTLEPDQLFL